MASDVGPSNLGDELTGLGLDAGLEAVGFTGVEVLEPARSILPRRKQIGLASSMQFTYRNPERSTDPSLVFKGAKSMVVGVMAYPAAEPDKPGSGRWGRVARYAASNHYERLRSALEVVAARLNEDGFRTVIVADTNALVDRNVAWRAGLGWYGKNANLLTPSAGSWVVIGSVVTNAELPSTFTQPMADGCRSCTACSDGCPTDAIVAPGVIDARRCLAWLVQAAEPIPVEFREAVGDRIYGCDICQDVCPPNRQDPDSTTTPTPVVEESGTWVDLDWILQAGDGELLDRHGAWYIANRDPNVIRRTALVVLGNTAEPNPDVDKILAMYLAHDNEMLREQAEWSAKQIETRR